MWRFSRIWLDFIWIATHVLFTMINKGLGNDLNAYKTFSTLLSIQVMMNFCAWFAKNMAFSLIFKSILNNWNWYNRNISGRSVCLENFKQLICSWIYKTVSVYFQKHWVRNTICSMITLSEWRVFAKNFLFKWCKPSFFKINKSYQ